MTKNQDKDLFIDKKNKKKAEQKVRIGEHLVGKKVVDKDAVMNALDIQSKTGSRIGEILQAQGNISAYKFYIEFAEFKDMEFVNLEETKIDKSLLLEKDKEEYYNMQYVPYSVSKDNKIKIAATDPEEELVQYLQSKYGEIELLITSPFDILWLLQKHFSELDIRVSSEELYEEMPKSSSKTFVASPQMLIIFILSLILTLMLLQQKTILVIFLVLMNLFYFSTLLSKVLFFTVGAFKRKGSNGNVSSERLSMIDDSELPIYSIIVPLYKEKEVTISQLLKGLSNLNYPKEKLDIKLALETKDFETLNIIKAMQPPSNIQIIRVPNSTPKTKPKACNYALRYCKGEFVTIYDAEDIPDPNQLKKVIAVFQDSKSDLGCVQSRLNYYNRKENVISKLFAIEYASWFDYMLYGLRNFKLPMPLGGTSNHFKTQTLKALYAWDPYNVTEDADLGIRISLSGLKTEVLNSYTMEECPIGVKSWFAQRTRWVKGYIQTYFVHMRDPQRIIKLLGYKGLLGFFFFVGAPFFVYLTAPLVLLISLAFIYLGQSMPDYLFYFSIFNLALSIIVHLILSLYICCDKKWYDIIFSSFIFPFYWLLHFAASYGALIELFKNPHKWNKTEHGVTKFTPELDFDKL